MSEEFVAPAPALGEPIPVAPLGQGGAEDHGTSFAGAESTQIAETPDVAPRPTSWTDDPEYRRIQSEKDKAIAAAQREARQAREAADRLAQQMDTQRQQQEEASFTARYESEYAAAGNDPAKQAEVYNRYQRLHNERERATFEREKNTFEAARTATQVRDQWANQQ